MAGTCTKIFDVGQIKNNPKKVVGTNLRRGASCFMDAIARKTLKRGTSQSPHAQRLRALMAILGYEGRGAQREFAKKLGVRESRLNNVLIGYPLSWQLVALIVRRFPRVSTDFLFLGRAGGHLDPALEQQLIDYEEKYGISIFTRP